MERVYKTRANWIFARRQIAPPTYTSEVNNIMSDQIHDSTSTAPELLAAVFENNPITCFDYINMVLGQPTGLSLEACLCTDADLLKLICQSENRKGSAGQAGAVLFTLCPIWLSAGKATRIFLREKSSTRLIKYMTYITRTKKLTGRVKVRSTPCAVCWLVVVQIFQSSITSGGFFLACEDFWENVRQFIPRLCFLFFFTFLLSFFFLKWRLAGAH